VNGVIGLLWLGRWMDELVVRMLEWECVHDGDMMELCVRAVPGIVSTVRHVSGRNHERRYLIRCLVIVGLSYLLFYSMTVGGLSSPKAKEIRFIPPRKQARHAVLHIYTAE